MNKGSQISSRIVHSLLALGLFILPGTVSAQPTPPTGSGGTGGGIPDSPLSVPFDSHLAILLIAAGVVFAISIIVKSKRYLQIKE